MKNNRFEIVKTLAGFMAYDHDCDEYLYDENKNNCFDSYWEASQLVDEAILAIREHS